MAPASRPTADEIGSWLRRPAPDVAPGLLGWRVRCAGPGGEVTVRVSEVEAYTQADPASHSAPGETPRNRAMFGAAGHLYVYRSHGIHWCMNVVTGGVGEGMAVLLRAGQVESGTRLAQARRGQGVALAALARGPGCLTKALGVSDAHYGSCLLDGGAVQLIPPGGWTPQRPTVAPAGKRPDLGRPAIVAGPRIGVSRAADTPWRWRLANDASVSSYRRSPRAPRRDG